VSEGTNRNTPARNTLVQLLALYTDPDSHNALHHRQTDRRTDRETPIADHTVLRYDRLKNHIKQHILKSIVIARITQHLE